jgi:hypothetical protein
MTTTHSELSPFMVSYLKSLEDALRGRALAVIAPFHPWTEYKIELPNSYLKHIRNALAALTQVTCLDPTIFSRTYVTPILEIAEYYSLVHRSHSTALSIASDWMTDRIPFALYLRSFSAGAKTFMEGEDYHVTAMLNTPYASANVIDAIIKTFSSHRLIQVQNLYDLQYFGDRGRIPAIRVNNHNWTHLVRDLIEAAKFIIVYAFEVSDGVRTELDLIRSARLESRTLVVSPQHSPKDKLGMDMPHFFLTNDFVANPPRESSEWPIGNISQRARALMDAWWHDSYFGTTDLSFVAGLPVRIIEPHADETLSGLDLSSNPYIIPEQLYGNWQLFLENCESLLMEWDQWARLMKEGKELHVDALLRILSSARLTIVTSASLGFYSSLAISLGIFARVFSMLRTPDPQENLSIKIASLSILDSAIAVDAISISRTWTTKLANWRTFISNVN